MRWAASCWAPPWVMLFPADTVNFSPDWAPARPVRLGEKMGDLVR